MRESFDILQAVVRTDQRCVLATIVRVEGSSYRKAGTSMLFCEDGRRIGLLSAGCLEDDLAGRADELFARREEFERGIPGSWSMICVRRMIWGGEAEPAAAGFWRCWWNRFLPGCASACGTCWRNWSRDDG
ncbi:XdhC family protein [Paenibacillus sp. CC-CFT747]|nr:XdhC family protein [Paenibacillus sp. CC-CFT747]